MSLYGQPDLYAPATTAATSGPGLNTFGDLTQLGAYGFVLGLLVLILFIVAWVFVRTYARRERVFMRLLFEERAENTQQGKEMINAIANSNAVNAQVAQTLTALNTQIGLQQQAIITEIKASETRIKEHVTSAVAAKNHS